MPLRRKRAEQVSKSARQLAKYLLVAVVQRPFSMASSAASPGVPLPVSGPTCIHHCSIDDLILGYNVTYTDDDGPHAELTTFQCREAYVYKIPPASTIGHRAELWDVDHWLQACAVLHIP